MVQTRTAANVCKSNVVLMPKRMTVTINKQIKNSHTICYYRLDWFLNQSLASIIFLKNNWLQL